MAPITPCRISLAALHLAALASFGAATTAHATPGLGVSQPGLYAPQSSFDAAPVVPDGDETPAPAPAPKKATTSKAAAIAALIARITDAPGAHITSDYGGRIDPMGDRGSWHSGVDIAAPLGASIFAAAAGVVTVATYDQGCGFMVEIEHKTGLRSRYCHAAALLVEKGELVDEGQRIAMVGATGEATGSHVHFEVRRQNGRAMNPHEAMTKRLLEPHASTRRASR